LNLAAANVKGVMLNSRRRIKKTASVKEAAALTEM
jgi:hypothetical protein